MVFFITLFSHYFQDVACKLILHLSPSLPLSFFHLLASPVTAMHRWWGESPSYVLLHLKSLLMARKAYILFPNEASHSGGFAPRALLPPSAPCICLQLYTHAPAHLSAGYTEHGWHTHTHTRAHMHANTHTHKHPHTQTPTHANTQTCMNTMTFKAILGIYTVISF